MICEVCKSRELEDTLEKEAHVCYGCQRDAIDNPEVRKAAFGVLKAHGKYDKAIGAE